MLSYKAGFDLFAEQETCQDIDLSPQSGLSRRSPERQEESFAAASTTAANSMQYETVGPNDFRFSVGTKTSATNTRIITQYNERQAKVMNLKTLPQIIIPKLPPMAMFPGEIVALTNNTWICHGRDQEVVNGKKRVGVVVGETVFGAQQRKSPTLK